MAETLLRTIGESLDACVRVAGEATKLLSRHGVKAPSPPDDRAICIALLGQYNAGKSTIVNSLLGEKCAKTGDPPETRKRQRYSLANYAVLDLPGGEARLAEQQEALAALDEAHAVLYVVSSSTGL